MAGTLALVHLPLGTLPLARARRPMSSEACGRVRLDYTSQMSTAWARDFSGSGLAGVNSCAR